MGIITAALGSSLSLGWIPDDIGKLATLAGLCLSIVLIRNHWRKGKIDIEKAKLERELLKRRCEEKGIVTD